MPERIVDKLHATNDIVLLRVYAYSDSSLFLIHIKTSLLSWSGPHNLSTLYIGTSFMELSRIAKVQLLQGEIYWGKRKPTNSGKYKWSQKLQRIKLQIWQWATIGADIVANGQRIVKNVNIINKIPCQRRWKWVWYLRQTVYNKCGSFVPSFYML